MEQVDWPISQSPSDHLIVAYLAKTQSFYHENMVPYLIGSKEQDTLNDYTADCDKCVVKHKAELAQYS